MVGMQYFEPVHESNLADDVVLGPRGMVLKDKMASRFDTLNEKAPISMNRSSSNEYVAVS